MKLKIYVFLFISFSLHSFFIIGLSFVPNQKIIEENIVSVNLNFSEFKEFDQAPKFEITKLGNSSEQIKEGQLAKKLLTESEINEAANLYVSAWQRQIESIGNSAFKKYFTQNELISLRLSATLNSKGELINYTLLKSSGNKSLDNVAVEILEMASPFLPFDASMKEFSEITIVRDWNFGLPKT